MRVSEGVSRRFMSQGKEEGEHFLDESSSFTSKQENNEFEKIGIFQFQWCRKVERTE